MESIYQWSVSGFWQISLGDITASEKNIYTAASKGGFSQVVSRLSEGYKTLLGKEFGGTSISGGEWQ